MTPFKHMVKFVDGTGMYQREGMMTVYSRKNGSMYVKTHSYNVDVTRDKKNSLVGVLRSNKAALAKSPVDNTTKTQPKKVAKANLGSILSGKTAPVSMKINHVGIARDHSGSMQGLSRAAMKDFNTNVDAIRNASRKENQKTYMTTVKFGVRGNGIASEHLSLNVENVPELHYYEAEGMTPLFDAVGKLITQFENGPDINNPNASFVIMAITDGQDNYSTTWRAHDLSAKIKALQATDRWTFIFRVPLGYKNHLENMGIPSGNILEWEQTEKGVAQASSLTSSAFDSFYAQRSAGMTASRSFYTDMSGIRPSQVKAALVDITSQLRIAVVNEPVEIRYFVENRMGIPYVKGSAFYQLTKAEKAVQDYKEIIIKSKANGHYYGGANARDLLGMPHTGTIRVVPGDHANYEIFIQSTSVNRRVAPGTSVLVKK